MVARFSFLRTWLLFNIVLFNFFCLGSEKLLPEYKQMKNFYLNFKLIFRLIIYMVVTKCSRKKNLPRKIRVLCRLKLKNQMLLQYKSAQNAIVYKSK